MRFLLKKNWRLNPDEAIGGWVDPYMLRWHIFRRKWLAVYLHRFRRSDHDRALHDHPSWSISIVLRGGYYEVLSEGHAKPSMDPVEQVKFHFEPLKIRWHGPGSIIFRRAHTPHRIAVGFNFVGRTMSRTDKEIWTIWIRGPVKRRWGFFGAHGWIFNRDYKEER